MEQSQVVEVAEAAWGMAVHRLVRTLLAFWRCQIGVGQLCRPSRARSCARFAAQATPSSPQL